MRYTRQILLGVGLAGVLVLVASCTYQAAMQRLTPAEQTAFRSYSKLMTSGQVRHYLRHDTVAERAAYLETIGITQRFQALAQEDRETVLGGSPRKGMSTEALRFLWGEPYYTEGRSGQYEQWYYLGSTWSLAESGNRSSEAGTIVVVHLIDGQVEDWLETVPTTHDDNGNEQLTR